jgi:TetR/AcrR family transcriptional repressor of nem operon
MHVFWRDGYRNTTTRVLEAELGVTQSSLYHAFGSKAQLALRVVERYRNVVDDGLFRPLREDANGLAALDGFFNNLRAWTTEGNRGCLITNLMADGTHTEEAIRHAAAAHRMRLYDSLLVAVTRLDPPATRPTARHRASLLASAAIGTGLAVRAGATTAEIGRMIAAVKHEIRSWPMAQL